MAADEPGAAGHQSSLAHARLIPGCYA